MNPKYTKVCSEIEKTEKKIADLQDQLSELTEKKTELENLEIINTVRAMVMDKDQVMAFLASMKSAKLRSSLPLPLLRNRRYLRMTKKKSFRLLTALALCVMLICSFSVTAFAYADDTDRISP